MKYADAVANGMSLLDREMPGWQTRINLKRLDMENGRECILGQLFGGFERGKVALNLDDGEAPYYGFFAVLPSSQLHPEVWLRQLMTEWLKLNAVWYAEVRARQELGAPVSV